MASEALLAHVVLQASVEPQIKKVSALPVEAFETITNGYQFGLIHAARVAFSSKTGAFSCDLGNSPLHCLAVGFVDQSHSNSFVKCQ